MAEAQGHHAATPAGIPAGGWWEIAKRTFGELGKDHVGLIAAGVAFYGLLALFPALTALVAIGGLLFEPSEITAQIDRLAGLLPQGAAEIITTQATEIAGSREGGLGIAVLVGIGLALYSASKGVGSLMEGINVAYDEEETRGFIRLTITKLALTLFLIVGMTAGLGATIVMPSILSLIELGPTTEMLLGLARWVVLLILTAIGIGVLYRYGPDRSAARVRWLTPGAALATILWLVASIGFAFYAENFGSYNESFGTLAGAIVLLMWLWISAYVLLLGAEFNGEAEQQTFHDTTVGKDMPMGARGAVKADTPPPGKESAPPA